MNSLNSADYHAAREQRERDLANVSSNPAVAAVHRDMAERYAQLVRSARLSLKACDDWRCVQIDQDI